MAPIAVFIDTEAIRVGADWPTRINDALAKTDVLMVVIGRSWTTISDKDGNPRLTRENDWVRNEIAHALRRRIHILPLLISGTEWPPKEPLPGGIEGHANKQAKWLNDSSWDRDLAELLTVLEERGFIRSNTPVMLFPARELRLRDLNHEEIVAARTKLPDWADISSVIPGQEPLRRIELRRVFEFASFKDAIRFINDVAKLAAQLDHHPRFENVWRTVTVWLSTWDIGQKPSQIDIDMAEKIDVIFAKYSTRMMTSRKRMPI